MNLEEQLNSKQRNYKDSVLLGRLFKYVRPYLLRFLFGIAIDALVVVIFSLEPRIIAQAVKYINEGAEYAKIVGLGLGYLGLSLLGVVIMFFSVMMIQRVGQDIVYDIRNDVFSHVENLSINQLNSLPVGKLVTRITNDTNKIMNLFTNVLTTFIRSFITLAAVLVNVLISSWKVGLILTAFLPLVFLIIALFRVFSRNVFRETRQSISSMNAFLAENLSGMKTTQIFNQEERKMAEFEAANQHLLKANLRQTRFFAIFRPSFYLVYITAQIVILAFSVFLVRRGEIGSEQIAAFYLFTSQFFNPIHSLADQFNLLQESLTGTERVMILIDFKPEVLDRPDAREVEGFEGKIEFQHVWFAYNPGEWILKDVSFVIEKGETAAFVGATGAGKSTIISLITRNYEAQKGQILIDGEPIESYTLKTLRRHIGEMLQDVFLFAGTIAENIALFDESVPLEKIEEGARYVGADQFIEKLPGGYQELVNERGNNFSMGQRQLISFARVVVYRPNIILLDEATANIDTETEVLIQSSLEKMKDIGTMVIVAHRLSTIKHADKIFVLSQGEIIEAGRHQELLKKRGTYYNLYRLQNMEKQDER